MMLYESWPNAVHRAHDAGNHGPTADGSCATAQNRARVGARLLEQVINRVVENIADRFATVRPLPGPRGDQ
jgi:hypothetical protein